MVRSRGRVAQGVPAPQRTGSADAGRQNAHAGGTPIAVTHEAGIGIHGMAARAASLRDKMVGDLQEGPVTAKEVSNQDGHAGSVLHEGFEVSAVRIQSDILLGYQPMASRTSGPTSS